SLPSRPVAASVEQIGRQRTEGLRNCPPFRVELREIQVFPVTQVIHLSIKAGFREAIAIHDLLNQGDLLFAESFQYHPHVTLGQDLTLDQILTGTELAKRRWRECAGRSFVADHLTLV